MPYGLHMNGNVLWLRILSIYNSCDHSQPSSMVYVPVLAIEWEYCCGVLYYNAANSRPHPMDSTLHLVPQPQRKWAWVSTIQESTVVL